MTKKQEAEKRLEEGLVIYGVERRVFRIEWILYALFAINVFDVNVNEVSKFINMLFGGI